MTDRKRGGNRPGAGRPRTLTDAERRRHTVSVRLNDAEIAKAERIGGGRPADGLRVALDRWERMGNKFFDADDSAGG